MQSFWRACLALMLVLASPIGSALANVFPIRPITFVDSPTYSMTATGTITTAGNTATITGWDVSLTTSSALARYTPATTVNLSYGDVRSDGARILVRTSPDGYQDGGIIYFRSPNPQQDVGVAVADFTGYNATGGQAMYMAGAVFDFLPLNQPNNVEYIAATRTSGNVYRLVPLSFYGGVTVSGTITTDGTVGSLIGHIVSWDISVGEVTEDAFRTGNSTVMANFVQFDQAQHGLTVTNPDGYLTLSKGHLGGHIYALTLADFSSTAPAGGWAGYFHGAFELVTIDLNAPNGPWLVTGLSPSSVEDAPILSLGQPWPNPTSGEVNIRLDIARSGEQTARVLDASGRVVATLLHGRLDAGSQLLRWDGRDDAGRLAPSGVYFLDLAGAGTPSRRITLTR